MKIYINRQAIFDSENEVVAYELLVKDYTTSYNEADENDKLTEVLKKVLIDFDVNMLAGGKRLYVSFTPQLIASGAVRLLNPQNIIVKVRHSELSPDVIKMIKGYRHEGYVIALEGDSIDLGAIDTSVFDIIVCLNDCKIINQYKHFNKVMFAKNVNSLEELGRAKSLGFSMFSGMHFQKPVLLEDDALVVIPSVYIQLLEELNKSVSDLDELSKLIMCDTNLTYSFLRLVNSVAYFANRKITSIKAALVRLGEVEMNKLLIVNILKNLSVSESFDEVLRLSLKRGKLAELLAKNFNLEDRSQELFLLGMFSLVNVIMRQPMKNILVKVPLAEDINNALLGKRNSLSKALELIIYHERDLTDLFNGTLERYNIECDEFNHSYVKALKWVDDIYES